MKNILKLRLNRHLLSLAMGVGMLGVLIVGNVGTAMADGGNGTFNVTAGSLSETTNAPSINNVALDGTNKTATITMPITVTDATGSGSGWHVTINASQFTGITSTNHLPQPSVSAVGLADVSGSTSTDPTAGSTTGLNLSVATTDVTLYSAAANSGLGKFTLTPTMTVAIPANTKLDTYTSTFAVGVVATP